jgi:hypothetical protein
MPIIYVNVFCMYVVVPRILFDGWSSDDFYSLFTTGTEPKELTKTIVTSLKVKYRSFNFYNVFHLLVFSCKKTYSNALSV